MESKFNFIVESELTENELANILGGGIISDLVVKGLTWAGDFYMKHIYTEDAALYL